MKIGSLQLERQLQHFLKEQKASQYTPGLKLCVYWGGKKKVDLSYGQVYPLYDMASLTKVVFTLEAFVQAWLGKKWSRSSEVKDFLPWAQALPAIQGKQGLKVEQILCHASGLPAWRPFYSKLLKCAENSSAYRWTFLSVLLRQELLKRKTIKVQAQAQGQAKAKGKAQAQSQQVQGWPPSLYSDVGFLLLGFILESLYDSPLLEVWKHKDMEQARKEHWHFCPWGKVAQNFKKSSYAPTRRCLWQKRILQGEVDDENARALGGVATHAGLFGSMEDLSHFGLLWRRRFHANLPSLKPFLQQRRSAFPWSLGWMFPSPYEAHGRGASCGRFFSPHSFGHTAFTGPSIWYDPQKDLLVLILSHRVHLSHQGKGKTNNRETYFRLRARLHDEIVRLLFH